MRQYDNLGFQKADCMQDMHYADFAEDDVGLTGHTDFGDDANPWKTECSFISSYKGIRG
jgi:hypothetical protein